MDDNRRMAGTAINGIIINGITIHKEMLQIARKQFCLDTCLDWQQYLEHPNQKVYIQKTQYASGTKFPVADGARRYAGMDSFFKAIMCMGQLFLSVDERIYDWAVAEFADCAPEWFCKYDNLRKIDEKLKEYGRQINDTHVYYLPGMIQNPEYQTDEGMRLMKTEEGICDRYGEIQKMKQGNFVWYEKDEIQHFKEGNRFTSAICFSPTQSDVLAVAAQYEKYATLMSGEKSFDQAQMMGMAGASEDGRYLWQIGINVLPEYTGKGLAVRLVSQIKDEIIRRGKVPFYGTSESHTISQTVALKAGFVPAWTEIYVKSIEK